MSNKKAKGKRSKTRAKMKAKAGKATVNTLLKEFKVGSRVQVVTDSSMHSGLPHKSFHGAPGIVTGKQGKLYTVDVKKGNLQKKLLVHAAHLYETK
ncbi:MAG: 50S ribosomal protein L21e [Candidatus Diapherotrites archaeon]|uniref:Large ribosomal subunit protein eL21 n=1 Tax=Candidatus Iainarchaeum sp. TaxID=3101447 RepID=A0A938YVA5_9ARCH|nr:50S ribosomal protein L21e [Candidatus Diapherotrites archaeon]